MEMMVKNVKPMIAIGTMVRCNVMTIAGKPEERIGKLIQINSRYATIECESSTLKVGSTRIKVVKELEVIRTQKGRKSTDIGDEVALSLRGCSLDQVYAAAADALGVEIEALKARYGHLSPGLIRMTLGLRMRRIPK